MVDVFLNETAATTTIAIIIIVVLAYVAKELSKALDQQRLEELIDREYQLMLDYNSCGDDGMRHRLAAEIQALNQEKIELQQLIDSHK